MIYYFSFSYFLCVTHRTFLRLTFSFSPIRTCCFKQPALVVSSLKFLLFSLSSSLLISINFSHLSKQHTHLMEIDIYNCKHGGYTGRSSALNQVEINTLEVALLINQLNHSYTNIGIRLGY